MDGRSEESEKKRVKECHLLDLCMQFYYKNSSFCRVYGCDVRVCVYTDVIMIFPITNFLRPALVFSSSKSRREQEKKWTYRLKVKRNYDKKANEQGKCIKIKIKKAFANIYQSKEIWTCDELNDLWNVKLAKLCRKHIFMLGRWWLFFV